MLPIASTLIAEVRVVADDLSRFADALKSTSADSDLAALAPAVEAAGLLSTRLRDYADELRSSHRRKLSGYPVGFPDRSGRTWFVSHSWNHGNLFRTPNVESAATWPTVEDVKGWVTAMSVSKGPPKLGKDAKPWTPPLGDLAGLTLQALPVAATVGPPAWEFTVGGLMVPAN